MNTMFSPDSKVMQLLNRAADLLILNLLFLLTSLPLITIGPSLAALYSMTLAMGTVRESGVLRGYFRAFRENFFPALRAWLVLLLVAAALVLDWNLFANFGNGLVWVQIIFGILLLQLLLASALTFPLISLFRNTTLNTLKNALVLSLGSLPRSVCIAALWLFPVLLVLRQPVMLPACAFAGITFYASAAAYVSGLLLRKVFHPFLPEDMFDKEETE